MTTTLCEKCLPAWGMFEELIVLPSTPCQQCGAVHGVGGTYCHVYRRDPRPTRGSVLEALKEAQVLTVKQAPGGFRFRERCDRYYQVVLTREQVLALADELRALVEKQPEQS